MAEVKSWGGAYGNEMKNSTEFEKNLKDNAIPLIAEKGTKDNYLQFLKERALLMSLKIKEYYGKL